MLLLTREANTYLVSEGLDDLTIAKNSAGYIEIAGKQCKKPMLMISSICVGNKLTVKEREIIMDDYIKPTVTKFKKEIKYLLTLAADNSKQEALDKYIKDIELKHDIRVKPDSFIDYHGKQTRGSAYLQLAVDPATKHSSHVNCFVVSEKVSFHIGGDGISADVARVRAESVILIVENALAITREYTKLYDELISHQTLMKETKELLVEKCEL